MAILVNDHPNALRGSGIWTFGDGRDFLGDLYSLGLAELLADH